MLKDGCDIAVTVDEVHTTMPDGAARHLIEGGLWGASLKFGIPNVSFETGDHICGFYRGRAERDEILFPYLRAGLEAGDKCTCIVDETDPGVVVAGVNVADSISSHQLEVQRSTDTYLLDGHFSTQRMISFWETAVAEAMSNHGFHFARSVGEMTWSLRDVPGVDELAGYESELNRFTPRYPQVILCLYDIDQFGGSIVVDMLKTHPRVLLGGMVLENPFYLSPDEFLATRA